MKYFIVAIFALVSPIFARPQAPQPVANPQQNPQPYQQKESDVTPVSIISQTEVVGADGSFNYSYDTSNGIHVEQGGFIRPAAQAKSVDPNNPDADSGDVQVIQGAYSYTAPDGQQISLRYVADENGFQPEGEHLPKAPPVPEDIARSLEQQPQEAQQQEIQQQPQQTSPAIPSPVTQA